MFPSVSVSLRRNCRNGSTLVIVLVTTALMGLLIPSLIRSFALKDRTQSSYRSSDAMNSVVDAVAVRALSELKLLFNTFGPGGPTPPIAPWPATARYTQLRPRIFPKGDPGFLVEEYQFDGTSFVPVKFVAPETDPVVWIARFGAGIGNNVVALRIQMTVCRISLSGRPIPAAPSYNLGVAWAPACPAEHIVQVNYTGLVPRANL